MSDAGVRLDREGPVATVTLCRPHVRNAQTPAMWQALTRFARQLTGDVRVVVVRGEGPAFSAGLDLTVAQGAADREFSLANLATLDEAEAAATLAQFQEAFSWLRRTDLISIAAVQGYAIGAGFQLALACDFRIVADDAQFAMAEVSLGLVPDLGGTRRLVELVGYARALELCVTGRRVSAAAADRLGLASSVVPVTELDQAVADLVATVLAAPRDVVIEIKALICAAGSNDFAAQLRAERAAQIRRIRDLAGAGE